MKRFAILAAVIAVLALCAGCGGLNETFIRAVDSNWTVMGPNYRTYVANDANLPEASKARRLAAIDDFTKMVKEYKADVDE